MEKRLKNLEDGYKWSRETVEALRAGDLSAIDMDSLIDEIESIHTGLERQLADYLRGVLKDKLRLQYVDAGDREIELSLVQTLSEMKNLLWAAPSLAEALTDELIEDEYRCVRPWISEDAGIELPEHCPYSRDTILSAIAELEFAA